MARGAAACTGSSPNAQGTILTAHGKQASRRVGILKSQYWS
jgi:hypothetical protein